MNKASPTDIILRRRFSVASRPPYVCLSCIAAKATAPTAKIHGDTPCIPNT